MANRRGGPLTAYEVVMTLLDWPLRAAVLVVLGVTLYYLYGTFSASEQLFRGWASPGVPMTVEAFERNAANMRSLTNALLAASVVVLLTAIGRYHATPEAGLGLLVFGVALAFGAPVLFENLGGTTAGMPPALADRPSPRLFLIGQYRIAGGMLAVGGILHLLVHGFLYVAGTRASRPKPSEENARTAAQVRRTENRFLGACWQLPFCRDTDKKLCPIRHANRSCWRTGRGCYCDQNVILAISGGGAYSASAQYAPAARTVTTVARPRTLSERREQCLQCPVYLHHQEQKYRVLAPLGLLTLAAVGYLGWESIRNWYPNSILYLGRALSGFSFTEAEGGVPEWAVDLAASQPFLWIFLIIGGALAVTWILQGLELVLYRLGL